MRRLVGEATWAGAGSASAITLAEGVAGTLITSKLMFASVMVLARSDQGKHNRPAATGHSRVANVRGRNRTRPRRARQPRSQQNHALNRRLHHSGFL